MSIFIRIPCLWMHLNSHTWCEFVFVGFYTCTFQWRRVCQPMVANLWHWIVHTTCHPDPIEPLNHGPLGTTDRAWRTAVVDARLTVNSLARCGTGMFQSWAHLFRSQPNCFRAELVVVKFCSCQCYQTPFRHDPLLPLKKQRWKTAVGVCDIQVSSSDLCYHSCLNWCGHGHWLSFSLYVFDSSTLYVLARSGTGMLQSWAYLVRSHFICFRVELDVVSFWRCQYYLAPSKHESHSLNQNWWNPGIGSIYRGLATNYLDLYCRALVWQI